MSKQGKKDFKIAKMTVNKEKLWSRNFFLLWQGQLVSATGDVFYGLALGFWVLKATGSTALMSTLMAVTMLPRIAVSPFAGVAVDRMDRKKLIILMDVIRGVIIGFIAAAAFMGTLKIWMLFGAGIGIGICTAFFNPAVSSSIPDITAKSRLIKANSVFGMIYNISGIVGNSTGGILFAIFGAAFIFLFNSVSYLFSAGAVIFMSIPKIRSQSNLKPNFFDEMKSGFRFVWNFKAIRYIMILASAVNFFGSMGFILLLPLFERNNSLGPKSYGLVIGFFMGGIFAGMLLTSVVNIRPSIRFKVFFLTSLLFSLTMASVPLYLWVPSMALLIFTAGICSAIINVFINTMVQLVIPHEMRGKVFSLQATLAGSLMPLGYAAGGIAAEFMPIRVLISSSCAIIGFLFIPTAFSENLKKFINYDPDSDTLNSIC
jgi:DHA3 family macrolide efflux protein-like MFS transporter